MTTARGRPRGSQRRQTLELALARTRRAGPRSSWAPARERWSFGRMTLQIAAARDCTAVSMHFCHDFSCFAELADAAGTQLEIATIRGSLDLQHELMLG